MKIFFLKSLLAFLWKNKNFLPFEFFWYNEPFLIYSAINNVYNGT